MISRSANERCARAAIYSSKLVAANPSSTCSSTDRQRPSLSSTTGCGVVTGSVRRRAPTPCAAASSMATTQSNSVSIRIDVSFLWERWLVACRIDPLLRLTISATRRCGIRWLAEKVDKAADGQVHRNVDAEQDRRRSDGRPEALGTRVVTRVFFHHR